MLKRVFCLAVLCCLIAVIAGCAITPAAETTVESTAETTEQASVWAEDITYAEIMILEKEIYVKTQSPDQAVAETSLERGDMAQLEEIISLPRLERLILSFADASDGEQTQVLEMLSRIHNEDIYLALCYTTASLAPLKDCPANALHFSLCYMTGLPVSDIQGLYMTNCPDMDWASLPEFQNLEYLSFSWEKDSQRPATLDGILDHETLTTLDITFPMPEGGISYENPVTLRSVEDQIPEGMEIYYPIEDYYEFLKADGHEVILRHSTINFGSPD